MVNIPRAKSETVLNLNRELGDVVTLQAGGNNIRRASCADWRPVGTDYGNFEGDRGNDELTEDVKGGWFAESGTTKSDEHWSKATRLLLNLTEEDMESLSEKLAP